MRVINNLFNLIDLFDSSGFRLRFQRFIEFMAGKPVFYNIETLRTKHEHLNLKNKDFNTFKATLIVS